MPNFVIFDSTDTADCARNAAAILSRARSTSVSKFRFERERLAVLADTAGLIVILEQPLQMRQQIGHVGSDWNVMMPWFKLLIIPLPIAHWRLYLEYRASRHQPFEKAAPSVAVAIHIDQEFVFLQAISREGRLEQATLRHFPRHLLRPLDDAGDAGIDQMRMLFGDFTQPHSLERVPGSCAIGDLSRAGATPERDRPPVRPGVPGLPRSGLSAGRSLSSRETPDRGSERIHRPARNRTSRPHSRHPTG